MLRPCTVFGCAAPAASGGRCLEHTRERHREVDRTRPTAWQRGYNKRWQQLRAQVLRYAPHCARCGQPSVDVHHIRSKRDGGQDIATNLLALCHRCHSTITSREQRSRMK